MRQALLQIVQDLGLATEFSDVITAEVTRLTKDPGIDDPSLVDLTDLPFVTIDGPTSKDLDQAVFVEAKDGGFAVFYALADAAHFVPPSSALFAEALRRGASFYFPGFSVPMLPRELCEGLISLNPNVDRRALVFVCELDASGAIVRTTVERCRVRSRAKLSFGQVQGLYDDPQRSSLANEPFRDSLEKLRVVGEKRLSIAEHADVVRYRRREVEVKLDDAELAFVILEAARLRVEVYNEQISLLVNREGGRLLAESKDPRLQPVYRIHPAPDPEKIAALRALTAGVARAHGLPDDPWTLRAGESLNEFVRRLPQGGPHHRIAEAVERQAIIVNMRSAYSTEPSQHFGVGAQVYARFSAPMREVVGVFLHKELLEVMGLEMARGTPVDEALRNEVVSSANKSRDVQRRVNDHTNRLVLDQLFKPDLALAAADRPARRGTVMGITPSKIHVELDSPGLDVKVYLRDVGKSLGGLWLDIVDDGARLVTRTEAPATICTLGDAVDIRVTGHDPSQDRFILAIERVPR